MCMSYTKGIVRAKQTFYHRTLHASVPEANP